MTAVGVICEYNPFHLGHEKQLRLLRQLLGADAAIVCLMSGDYVQRGQPAVFDKRTRAAAAVSCGASLVLELPVTNVLRSAEGFAQGGVRILSALGVVEYLGFGCESGDGDAIFQTARAMCNPGYDRLVQQELSKGLPYPVAMESALAGLTGGGALLQQPNDILAVEYCKAILRQNSPLKPLAIRREGSYHASEADAENPSATAVRKLLETGDWRPYVPEAAASLYETAPVHTLSQGERAMLARLRGLTQADWERAAHGSEGLWSKVWKAVQTEPSVEAILTAAKSKRYPRTRLQRLLLCAYLGIDADTLAPPAPYVRILAFDERGQKLLKTAADTASLPMLHAGQAPREETHRPYYELETRCAGLYSLFAPEASATPAALGEKTRIFKK